MDHFGSQMDLNFIKKAYLIDIKRYMRSKLNLNMHFDQFTTSFWSVLDSKIDHNWDNGAIEKHAKTMIRSSKSMVWAPKKLYRQLYEKDHVLSLIHI